MKKIIAVLVAAGVIGVPAATWHFGNQAEANAQNFATALSQAVPYVTVAGSDYKKGFLSSTQTIRLMPAIPGMDAKPGQEVVIENVIEHGPLPGFKSFGAARITHNIVWAPETKAKLAKVWGDQQPLTAVTTMSIGGGGSTTFTSPAVTGKEAEGTFAFKGLDGKMNFNANFDKIDYTLSSDGASFDDNKKEGFTLGKIAASGEQTKMAGTEKIYLGKQQASFAGMDVTKDGKPMLSIKQIAYNAESISPEANFINSAGKLTGASLTMEGTDYGGLEYAFNMQKLHAPSLDALSKSLQAELGKMSADPKNATAPSAMNDVMLKVFKQHLPEMSKHSPTFSIDKMRVGNAKDYAQLNVTARLLPIVAADFDNPMMMLPKIDASMNVELSESIVALLSGQAASKMGGADPAMMAKMTPEMKTQADAQTKQMVEAQLAGAVQEGYIVRGNGKISAAIALKGGNLTINGKPIGGGMLGK